MSFIAKRARRSQAVARLVAAFLLVAGVRADALRVVHADVDLIAEPDAIAAGVPFFAGIRIRHDAHWHSYWENPGDAGMATRVTWTLPPGFQAGSLQWPSPGRFESEGLVSFGYEGEVVLLTEITPPRELPEGQSMSLKARVSMLLCREVCIPASADVTLSLPVRPRAKVSFPNGELFQAARRRIPRPDSSWTASARQTAPDVVTLKLLPPEDFDIESAPIFFPFQRNLFVYEPPSEWDAPAHELAIPVSPTASEIPATLTGVAVVRGRAGGEAAVRIDIPLEKDK